MASKNTDLELEDQEEREAGDTPASPGKSAVDYEAKYRGLSRKFSKLQTDHEKLQEMYDDAQAEVENSRSAARNGNKELEKQLKEIQTKFDASQQEIASWQNKVKAFEVKETARKTLSQKFPQLMDLNESGDLKSPDQFEKPEDYEAYLGRIAAKMGPATPQTPPPPPEGQQTSEKEAMEEWLRQRNQLLGVTPQVPLGSRNGTQPRTVDQITEEMMALDSGDPNYGQKYMALEGEMNQALDNRKKSTF